MEDGGDGVMADGGERVQERGGCFGSLCENGIRIWFLHNLKEKQGKT